MIKLRSLHKKTPGRTRSWGKGKERAVILLAFLLLQGSVAQSQNSGDTVPNYSVRISLPPVASAGDALTLPELPIYDKDNLYLQVRDSSQDWYDANLLNQEQLSEGAIYTAFAEGETLANSLQGTSQDPEQNPSSNISSERENRASLLLDAEQRILSDLQDSDILLDEVLMPIPR